MNTLSPVLYLGCAAGMALTACTIRAIKQNLMLRWADRASSWGILFFATIESLLWICFFLALVIAAPHPTTILLCVLLIVSIAAASRLRYIEEVVSLNRWLRISASKSTSLPALVEGLASGSRSHLCVQARKFVQRINQGVSIMEASRQSRLPLDADTIAAWVFPSANSSTTDHRARRLNKTAQLVRDFRDSTQSRTSLSMTLSMQQFVYGVATVVLAWGLGIYIRSSIVPMLRQIDDVAEMGFEIDLIDGPLNAVAMAGNVVMVMMVTWLLAAFLIEALPPWSIRWVPWFGRRTIDQRKCELLGALHRGTHAGHPADQIFEFAKTATRSKWVRKCCRKAQASINAGATLPTAMYQCKLINATQQKWIASAQANGNLPRAMEQMSDHIERSQTSLWKRRMAWGIPVTIVAVGFYVLVHAVYVFQFLTNLILGNS